MFLWRVKGNCLKHEIWAERQKTLDKKDLAKAFPPSSESHRVFEMLVATYAPLANEIDEAIRAVLCGDQISLFDYEVEIKSIEQLGSCNPPLEGK